MKSQTDRLSHILLFALIALPPLYADDRHQPPLHHSGKSPDQYFNSHPYIAPTYHPVQHRSYQAIDNLNNRIIRSDSSLNGSIFNAPINLLNSTVEGSVNLNGSRVVKAVNLKMITMNHSLNASWLLGQSDINAYQINLMKPALFQDSVFDKNVSAYNMKCHELCSFSMAHFNGNLEIRHTQFLKAADFSGIAVNGSTVFDHLMFSGPVDLRHSQFNGPLDLRNSTFVDGLDLSYSTLQDSIRLQNIIVQNTLNLSNIKLAANQTLDLSGIEPLNPGQPISVNLTNVPIKQIHMNYLHFKLVFDANLHPVAIKQTYVDLLHQYQSQGSPPGYRRLYTEYQNWRYRQQKRTVTGFIDRHLWNYGLDKQIALIWLAAAFLLFSVINALIWPTLAKHYTTINFLSNINISEPQKYNPILRFTFFFPYGVVFTVFLFAGGFLSLGARMATFKGSSILMMSYLLLIRIVGYCALFVLFALIVQ